MRLKFIFEQATELDLPIFRLFIMKGPGMQSRINRQPRYCSTDQMASLPALLVGLQFVTPRRGRPPGHTHQAETEQQDHRLHLHGAPV